MFYNYSSSEIESKITKQPYVRCNGSIPDVPKNHVITIKEKKEFKWGIFELMRFNITHLTVCIECAGNSRQTLPYETEGVQWDNKAVSNVMWSGVLLKSVLNKVPEDAKEIVFTSLDKEFTRSLPVSVIYERPVLLAYLMNQQSLLPEHGFPIRLIVPGWYGMASVKWLDQIYFTDKFDGKYQTEKYTYQNQNGKIPVSTILPKSLITSIGIQNPIEIKGKAWSGNKIEKVEVNIDGTWIDADIKERTGDYGWVLWEKKMILKGNHKISSRATDITGLTQPEESIPNTYGYGNNAIQVIQISV